MESGSSKEPKGSSEEAVSSPGPEVAAAAPGAGDDEAATPAVSPPAPAATTRPYYECVFCKRGFTTAQALGGHMNIHRRDRAKPSRGDTHTPPSGMASVSRNDVECYNQYHNLAPYPPAPPATAPMSSSSSSSSLVFATYYRSTGAATGVVDGVASVSLSPGSASTRELSLFGAAARDHDLHLVLGCHGRGGDGSHASPERSERQAAAEPDRELDLELRLGRRPRN